MISENTFKGLQKTKNLIVILFFFLLCKLGYSQDSLSLHSGNIHVVADERLDSLVQIQTRKNEEKQSMPGYRVQIYFGPDRKKANEIKAAFLQKKTEVHAYVIYQQPNYKVRTGDFRTRLEAYKLLQELSAEYASSFVVKDDIALPPIE